MSNDQSENQEQSAEQTAGSRSEQRRDVDALMLTVQQELRKLAGHMLRAERPNHTLQATALVNEAYLRMVDQDRVPWKSKTQFFAISARMMRRILVDHARKNRREKRGGDRKKIQLTTELLTAAHQEHDILVVDDTLRRLAELDPRQAEVVELRFFGGMSVQEIADTLGVSKRTVESDWTVARAWLQRALTNDSNEESSG